MFIHDRARLRTNVVRLAGLWLAAVLVLSSCSGDGSDDGTEPPATSTSTTSSVPITAAVDQVPQPSAEDAVTAVLAAEQAGDRVGSFAVLSDAARRLYPDQAEWQDRRNELPVITGFTVEEVASDQVTVLVEHTPGLDPFLGLSAARERQVWTAVAVDGGWLVDAEPDTEYVLPSDDDARAAALDWARSVQACDEEGAATQQALPKLYGASTQLATFCGADGEAVAGPVADLEAGPASADIVSQYSSDALIWARSVVVTISGGSVTVSLAPIGDVWKVMGVSD